MRGSLRVGVDQPTLRPVHCPEEGMRWATLVDFRAGGGSGVRPRAFPQSLWTFLENILCAALQAH